MNTWLKPECRNRGDAYLLIYRHWWTARQFAFEGEWGRAGSWAGDAIYWIGHEVSLGNIAGDYGKLLSNTAQHILDAIYLHKLKETDEAVMDGIKRITDIMFTEVVRCQIGKES